jgi:hypothetical protein
MNGSQSGTQRELAQRFLLTMGAKALILVDKGQSKEHVLQGLDEELDAKAEMLLEENTKSFKRKMHLFPGVLATKRGRNGTERKVHVRYTKLVGTNQGNGESNGHGDFCITWVSSFFGIRKTFDISTLTSAPDATNEGVEDGFVKLSNRSRELRLKFSADTHPYFLHHLISMSTAHYENSAL